MWGMEDGSTTTLPYVIQSTASNAQISAFVCPSDLYAGDYVPNSNSYFGSLGTSTYYINANTTTFPTTTFYASSPSTGLFTYQASYGINSIVDGTSNTIAFCESTVGNPNGALGQVNIGLTGIAIQPAAQVQDANSNVAAVLAGLAACDAAWTGRTGTVDDQRGKNWIHGSMAFTLFNTVALPNSAQWTYCSSTTSGSASTFSEAGQLPLRRREHAHVRRLGAIRQEHRQPPDLVGPRDQVRRRGPRRQHLLTPTTARRALPRISCVSYPEEIP